MCRYGELRTKTCWDGSIIATHQCIVGEWVETGLECPLEPSPDVKKMLGY